MSIPKHPPPTVSGIGLLPPGASVDLELMAELTELVNRVYAAAEEGLWRAGATRTTLTEMADFVRAGQIAVARLDGAIVGCVRVQQLDETTGEFGMLAADPGCRRLGLGRQLVEFAEVTISERGLRTVRLELLVPRTWTHPVKEFLRGWYKRLGYRAVRTGTIDEQYPELAALLATPCDYVIYHKDLGHLTASRGH